MLKAEHYINVGYQKILTFERPGGGFDWWGRDPALVWLSAYGMQQLGALAKIKDIDTEVIQRTQNFLKSKQSDDGSWGAIGGTHGETIARVAEPKFALTSYVAWSLAESGVKDSSAISYIKKHYNKAKDNAYLLALAANALLSVNPQDQTGLNLLEQLQKLKEEKEDSVHWAIRGQTASCAYGNAASIEVSALCILAMTKARKYGDSINKAMKFIVKNRDSYGSWGSTQATILALKCLIATQDFMAKQEAASVDILINGQKSGHWELNDNNRDLMQIEDLSSHLQPGENKIQLAVKGKPNVIYQVIGRYFVPHKEKKAPVKTIELDIQYDKTTLKRHDTIVARANFHYHGTKPTFMVIIDLGIPPGFNIDPGDFAELLGENMVKKYSITSNQVTLYLGDINPGQKYSFRYHLKAKYPLKVKTPKSIAYEYYSPQVRTATKPVDLIVK